MWSIRASGARDGWAVSASRITTTSAFRATPRIRGDVQRGDAQAMVPPRRCFRLSPQSGYAALRSDRGSLVAQLISLIWVSLWAVVSGPGCLQDFADTCQDSRAVRSEGVLAGTTPVRGACWAESGDGNAMSPSRLTTTCARQSWASTAGLPIGRMSARMR